MFRVSFLTRGLSPISAKTAAVTLIFHSLSCAVGLSWPLFLALSFRRFCCKSHPPSSNLVHPVSSNSPTCHFPCTLTQAGNAEAKQSAFKWSIKQGPGHLHCKHFGAPCFRCSQPVHTQGYTQREGVVLQKWVRLTGLRWVTLSWGVKVLRVVCLGPEKCCL